MDTKAGVIAEINKEVLTRLLFFQNSIQIGILISAQGLHGHGPSFLVLKILEWST